MRRTRLTIPIPSPTPTTSIPTQPTNARTPPPPRPSPTPTPPTPASRPALLHYRLSTGRYDVGSGGTPEALRKQLLALQKQPAAMRALRDAMLLEGKVTQSGL